MSDKGIIQNRARKRQIADFSGLRFGNITPTDIDGFIDFQDKVFIWFEMKHTSAAEIPQGQRMALERVCDASQKAGKDCYVFLAEHSADDADQDINAAIAVVVRYRHAGQWHEPKDETTIRSAIDTVLKKNDLGYAAAAKRCSCCGLPYPGKWIGHECELCYWANKAWES